MKITKEKIQKIIQEELNAALSTPKIERDLEGEVAKDQLLKIAKYALGLYCVLDDSQELESWVQNKITLADDYVSKVVHYLESELQLDVPDPDLETAIESVKKEPEMPENENYAGRGNYYYDEQ